MERHRKRIDKDLIYMDALPMGTDIRVARAWGGVGWGGNWVEKRGVSVLISTIKIEYIY